MCCAYNDNSIKASMIQVILFIAVTLRKVHEFIWEISFFYIKKLKIKKKPVSLSYNFRSAKINRAPTIADKQISTPLGHVSGTQIFP